MRCGSRSVLALKAKRWYDPPLESMSAYAKKVFGSAAIALAAFGMACGTAFWLLPDPSDCVVHSRNPYRFRDWSNFVRGTHKSNGAAQVVLISDSQGYAGEYPARRSYAARLEEMLAARKPGGIDRWEVLNLSVDGVTPMEYVALAGWLRDASPEWLISVSGSADYRAENYTKGFAFPRTDLPGLLTDPALARRIPFSFWRRHGRVEDTLAAWVVRRNPLLRFRDFAWSWLDVRYPGAQKAFYAPRTTYRFWELRGKARTPPVAAPFRIPGENTLDLTYDDKSSEMLEEFLDALAMIPARHRLVATAPLKSDFSDSREGPWIRRFRDDLRRMSAERGLPFEDLTDALPPEDFITSNHFHDRNHRRMAELLVERIAAEMGN